MLAKPGHTYFGAADLPWFVSVGMLLDGAAGEGFDRVQVWAREDFPLPFEPPPGEYSHVAIGRYFRPTERRIFLPTQVKWVFDLTPVSGPVDSDAPPSVPTQPAPPSKPPIARPSPLFLAGYYGSLGAIVLGAGFLARKYA